ncbi:methyltransferase domain-containing protein [Kribbella sp. NBC_01245]|uniref:class I SAM-dependent methyltransferase n=1 Tax=Kribbella sp. NBC_01245 TaxID=2903578 RepID=UPI002E2B0F07|nr:class I SAM-dependent methyltransferase [Kribbella sp. NBC_01245]
MNQQTATPTLEEEAAAFTGRVVADTAAAAAVVMAALGDRLGLFKSLAGDGSATSAALARRTGLDERYVREWLSGMYAAGYLTYEPAAMTFAIPDAHIPTLAAEPGPAFFGGVHQELLGAIQRYDQILTSFRSGGGVHHDHLHPDVGLGTARFTAAWHEHLLVPEWLPLVPETRALLDHGADVADVGCGAGLACISLARNFPASRFVGYDVSQAAVDAARLNAKEAGVEDRVSFEVLDASQGLPRMFDVITTFDVVHDAVAPRALLRSIRDALREGGRYLCLDINCSAETTENVGPIATLLYGFSLLYCMTTSLAEGGEGLGTLGLPESVLRELAAEAGFSGVRRAEMDNPFNSLYEVSR